MNHLHANLIALILATLIQFFSVPVLAVVFVVEGNQEFVDSQTGVPVPFMTKPAYESSVFYQIESVTFAMDGTVCHPRLILWRADKLAVASLNNCSQTDEEGLRALRPVAELIRKMISDSRRFIFLSNGTPDHGLGKNYASGLLSPVINVLYPNGLIARNDDLIQFGLNPQDVPRTLKYREQLFRLFGI